ncbi:MAG: prepilin-type N-terminal cleavage/methylation domain-containing protein [Fibrobacterales bacterium]
MYTTCSLQRGVTIIELIVTMVVASIVLTLAYSLYTNSYGVSRGKRETRQHHLAIESRWGSVEQTIAYGDGLIAVYETGIYYQDKMGLQRKLSWNDTMIFSDNRALFPHALSEVSCGVEGKQLDEEQDGEELFALDSDGDGLITQDELDQDMSGLLEGSELNKVRTMFVRFVYGPRSRKYESRFFIRNRIQERIDIEALDLDIE